MRRVVCLLVCALGMYERAEAANRTVCASGCQYTNLQTAINDAVAGDVILLRAGETFKGNFTLRAKSSTSTAFITIRSDAPDSSLPADGVRLIPYGRPGANVAAGKLPRLVGQSGTWQSTPVIRTEPGAHHYRLQFLEIDGIGNLGYGTLVQLGEHTSAQTTFAAAPRFIVLDRVYLHGHHTKGMRRGIALNSAATDILNSYIVDFLAIEEAQAIAGWNGAGPFRIINNHLEATGENIMFGGSDPKTLNLVPSDIIIRGNYLTKPLAWRTSTLSPPASVTTTAGTGGTLAAGTHYFKVVAVMDTGGSQLVSAPSIETAVQVGASGSVRLSWAGVRGADRYRVYRGTASNGQTLYVDAATTAITFTGSGQNAGTPPKTGTRWSVKNLLEFKNAQRVTVDSNLIENLWAGFQSGYAVLMTPRNQENTAPWSTVRDVTITNNTIRHVGGAFNILGTDDYRISQPTKNIRIAGNLAYDVSGTWGDGRFVTISSGPSNVTIDHNTIISTGTIVNVGGPPVYGFTFTNNLLRHNTYGVQGQNRAPGNQTLATYFPGAVFKANVLAGGLAGSYPAGNFFPTVSTFEASFVDKAAGNYALIATSPYKGAGTDGRDIGIDGPAVLAAQVTARTGASGGVLPGGSVEEPDPTPQPEVPPDGGTLDPLPDGWESADVGTTVLPGDAAEHSGTFTIRGAGADIWGTSDAFHFAYRTLTGDGVIVARVTAVTGSDPWTKVGVMIRASAASDAANATMAVSKGNGTVFQRRHTAGGRSTSTLGPYRQAPQWVRLTRAGTTISAAVSNDGVAWTTVGSDTVTMPGTVLVGLVTTSHDVTTLATGSFDNVALTTGSALPSGWESRDVGSVGAVGSAVASGGTFTLNGAGADIWGSADAFHFASRALAGNGEIVARVATIAGSDAWIKVGVMMRHTTHANSAHAFMLVSAGKGIAFQRRTVSGGVSTNTGSTGGAPSWVKLSRRGDVITASVSTNGTTWRIVGSDVFGMFGDIEVGLAVSSHDPTRVATATFDSVTVTALP